MGTVKGNGRRDGEGADVPALTDRLAFILADMLAEVLAKETTHPLGAPGPQGVGSAARECPARGEKT
jgi:hypothetical protein